MLADALTHPGLVVIAGPRASGKTALVRATGMPLLAARALAPLRHRAGLPLARAIRAPIPVDDVALAAEAVRVRLGERALLVDDVQHADAYTLAVLASVAPVVPVAVTLRTPSPIADRLRAVSRLWLDLSPRPDPSPRPDADEPEAVARTLAALPVAARTALATLGLLGRPAPASLLGPGVDALLQAGLVEPEADEVVPRPAYLAEVAAGVLAPAERRALHARLGAALSDGVEAARHLVAAGSPAAAAARAGAAAAEAETARERAAALLVAVVADPALALPAAAACGAAGLAGDALRLLSGPVTNGPTTRVGAAALRAAALVDLGHPDDAAVELRAVDVDVPNVPPAVADLHAVASIRAAIGTDPEVACTLAEFTVAAAGGDAPPALLAAHAAALRAAGRDSWEDAARAALDAAAAAGDRVAERLAGRGAGRRAARPEPGRRGRRPRRRAGRGGRGRRRVQRGAPVPGRGTLGGHARRRRPGRGAALGRRAAGPDRAGRRAGAAGRHPRTGPGRHRSPAGRAGAARPGRPRRRGSYRPVGRGRGVLAGRGSGGGPGRRATRCAAGTCRPGWRCSPPGGPAGTPTRTSPSRCPGPARSAAPGSARRR